MKKFITLTKVQNANEKFWVREDSINGLKYQNWMHKDDGTIVTFVGGGSEHVRELPEAILSMITPPMTADDRLLDEKKASKK